MNKRKREYVELTPHKVLDYNGKSYLYLGLNGAIYSLDDNCRAYLAQEGKSKTDALEEWKCTTGCTEEDYNKVEKQFADVGLIRSRREDINIEVPYLRHRLTGVELIVSQKCNMKCDYCYADQGEYGRCSVMSWDIVKASIDFLVLNSKEKCITVSFFGGEPLLMFPMIEKAVEYGRGQAIECGKKIKFAITTNGTLITEEIGRFLNMNRFSVNVSIDGDELYHNKHRVFKDGSGTYHATLRGMHYLDPNFVTIRSTVVPDIGDIVKLSNGYAALGPYDYFWGVDMSQFFEQNKLVSLTNQLRMMCRKFENDILYEDYKACMCNKLVYNILKRLSFYHERRFYCDALYKGIAIDTRGDVYPCHRFCGKEAWKLGNICNAIDDDLAGKMLGSFRSNTDNKCRRCWANNICGGGCPYENRYSFMPYTGMPDIVCDMWKSFYLDVLNLYLGLTNRDKVNLGMISK